MSFLLPYFKSLWLRLSALAQKFNLRWAILILAVALAFFPGSVSLPDKIDRQVLGLMAILDSERETSPPQVAVIRIPQDELNIWQQDVYAASNFSALLANVLESRNTTIGLMLREPVDDNLTALDNLLQREYFNSGNEKELYLKHKNYLAGLLHDPRIVLGLIGAAVESPATIKIVQHHDFPARLQSLMLRKDCQYCISHTLSNKGDPYYYLPMNIAGEVPLLTEDDGKFSPSFIAAMLWTAKGLRTEMSTLVWDPRVSLSSDSMAVHLSRYGSFQPAAQKSPAYRGSASVISLREAMVSNSFPKIVLIASETEIPLAQDMASVLENALDDEYFVLPWWGELAERLSYLAVGLILVFGVALIRRAKWYWIIVIALALGLLAAEVVLTLIWNDSVYFAGPALFIVLAALLLNLWQLSHTHRQHREGLLRRKLSTLAASLESAGEFREAVELVSVMPGGGRHREKIFRIIDQMVERDNNVSEALELLTQLRDEQGESRALVKKIAQLKELAAQTSNPLAQTGYRDALEAVLPKTLGRYQIQRELGRGAVGVVYLGFDPAISRKVAIKTLNYRQFSADQVESLKARFFREAEAAGRLSHPNIVAIYDVGEQGELAYIAMDYVDGASLGNYANEENLLPVADVYRIIHDVALALDYAHNHQVIHRDIKPGNILYCASPYQVKVADFGIARLLDSSRTTTGEILGSPLYMAPEQLKGSKVDVTADIFSLGVTFYQLLAGKLPFNADNLASLTYEIIHSKPKAIRHYRKDLPTSAARIVNQCLQKHPGDRYESALELASVLKKAIRRDFPLEAKEIGFD